MAVAGGDELGRNLLVHGGDTESERAHSGGDDLSYVRVDALRVQGEPHARGEEQFAAHQIRRRVLDLGRADRTDPDPVLPVGACDLAQTQGGVGEQSAQGHGRLLGLGHEETSFRSEGLPQECRNHPMGDSILDRTATSAPARTPIVSCHYQGTPPLPGPHSQVTGPRRKERTT